MKWICLIAVVLLMALLAAAPVTATDMAITATPQLLIPTVTASAATNVTDTSGTLHGDITDLGASNVTCRGFEWGYATGNYTASWNQTGTFETGAFSHTITGLTPNAEVFWRAFAINSYGQGNSTELSFTTVTLPAPPTDFTVTEIGNTIVSITWTMGTNADTTIIRCSSGGYPRSITDGYLVYSGNGTSVTVDGLNLDISTYYYRAWSQNEYGYSTNYAQEYAGNPIGIPAIMFVIGLCGFALWKKDWLRVLLSICIIIWGVFAMPYEIKIAAPLVTLGTFLFIMGILRNFGRGEQTEW